LSLDLEQVFVVGWRQDERMFALALSACEVVMVAVTWEPPRARRQPVPAKRYQLVVAFAAILTSCAVWAQAAIGSGGADRRGSGPLTALAAGPTSAGGVALATARVWVVQPGDTLWGIARHLQPAGDVRPLVDQLSRQLRGGTLQVGQRLVVP
jgi:hypothetical protein